MRRSHLFWSAVIAMVAASLARAGEAPAVSPSPSPPPAPAAPVDAPMYSHIVVYATAEKAAAKLGRPSKENPVYYVPLAAGPRVEGAAIQGSDPMAVTTEQVYAPLRRALAAQGYLPVGSGTPPPKVLLVFHWGAISPNEIDDPAFALDDGTGRSRMINEQRVGAMVGAPAVGRSDPEYSQVVRNATEQRFFVVVSAFDWDAAALDPKTAGKKDRKKLLWRARMSVPVHRTNLLDSLVPLIATGAPYFGEQTKQPREVPVRRGTVELGDPEVIELNPASTAPPSASPTMR